VQLIIQYKLSAVNQLGLVAAFTAIIAKALGNQNNYSGKTEDHHIVAENTWDECGRVNHDFYLNDAREVIKFHYGDLDADNNKVKISKKMHKHVHTTLYYFSIYANFPKKYCDKDSRVKVENKLSLYQTALKGVSFIIDPTTGVL